MNGWTVFFMAVGIYALAAKALELVEHYCG